MAQRTPAIDSPSGGRAWRTAGGATLLRVRLTPRAAHEAIDGMMQTGEGPALSARVRAVPEDGAANAALERLVAARLGMARRDVAVASGLKSRVKTLRIGGDPAVVEAALLRLVAALDNLEEG